MRGNCLKVFFVLSVLISVTAMPAAAGVGDTFNNWEKSLSDTWTELGTSIFHLFDSSAAGGEEILAKWTMRSLNSNTFSDPTSSELDQITSNEEKCRPFIYSCYKDDYGTRGISLVLLGKHTDMQDGGNLIYEYRSSNGNNILIKFDNVVVEKADYILFENGRSSFERMKVKNNPHKVSMVVDGVEISSKDIPDMNEGNAEQSDIIKNIIKTYHPASNEFHFVLSSGDYASDYKATSPFCVVVYDNSGKAVYHTYWFDVEFKNGYWYSPKFTMPEGVEAKKISLCSLKEWEKNGAYPSSDDSVNL